MSRALRTSLSATEARRLLSYDPETGHLTWRLSRGGVKAGTRAGWSTPAGYIMVTVGGVDYFAHRVAWLIVHGEWPLGELDHISGVKSENWLANLRDVPKYINGHNRGLNRNNVSGLRGVSLQRGRWCASIQINKRRMHLGAFPTKEEAGTAYRAAAIKHLGFCRSA